MTEIDAPGLQRPAFWLEPALLLPLAAGGLGLVGLSLGAEFLLAAALDPLLAGLPETRRALYLVLARSGGQLCVLVVGVVAARAAIKRIEGGASGVLADMSLFAAMFIDHSGYVWLLLVLMATDLGGWAAVALLGPGAMPASLWFLPIAGAWLALRLIGLAVERADPALWSQIQTRATRRMAWPSPRKLALLLLLAALTQLVGILPGLVRI